MSNEPTTNEDAETGADETEETKSKGLGLVPMIAAAVIVAGVAGGAAFVLTPGAKETSSACLDLAALESGGHGEEHAASDEHGDNAALVEQCEAEKLAQKKENKKAKKSHGGGHGGEESAPSNIKPLGEVQHTDYATFVVMDPIVVSISPIGRSKHLKISLVLETDDDGAADLLDHGFYVQDVLNTFLRSVDGAVLEDPAAMSRLRAQILRRVRAIVPDASVQNVLITEFVLT